MNTITITLSADEVIKLIRLLSEDKPKKPWERRVSKLAPYGFKKDGTPKKAVGRPRKAAK